MKRFALLGAAGYIAPRHMRAIKETGNILAAALDPNDSVGVIDSYFPTASFFTEPERFDRHVDKLRRRGEKIDFFSICSPNYLHDSHIRLGLRSDCDVICEKPIVINYRNLEFLYELEQETGRHVAGHMVWSLLESPPGQVGLFGYQYWDSFFWYANVGVWRLCELYGGAAR